MFRAPVDGVFQTPLELGMRIVPDQLLGRMNDLSIRSEIGGILRGLIRTGTRVKAGTKLGDIDPREKSEYLNTISDKARAIGGSVLEGIMAEFNQ